MKKFLLIACAFVLVLSSCKKKEYPETVTGSPEFYVKANVDGEPLLFQAGSQDYYMYSSYEQNTDGIYSFIADVKQKSCGNNCPNSLRIEIFDDEINTHGAPSNANSSLKVGANLPFLNSNTVSPTIVGYAVSFKSSFNLPNASSYHWRFGYGPNATGPSSLLAEPTHTYATQGIYNPTLVVSSGTTTTFIDNPIKVTTNPNVCRARIVSSSLGGNAVAFSASVTGAGPFSYLWEFGDGSTEPGTNVPIHTYGDQGRYLVKLRVVDAGNSNDTAIHYYYVNTKLSEDPAPNFYAEKVTPILSNSPLGKVKITYIDGNGTVYTSSLEHQINSPNFQIVSVQDYDNNEKFQATKKIKITFNCRLFSDSSAVDITGGEAVVAVAYK